MIKGKKFKEIIVFALTAVLVFPSNIVYGSTVISEVKGSAAPPHKESIVRKLADEGKIESEASQEEIDKIYMEYIHKKFKRGKLNPKEVENLKHDLRNTEEKGMIEEEKIVNYEEKSFEKIQEEKWEGDTFVSKPLVILMDFPNYKHTDFYEREKDSAEFLYENYDKEHYRNIIFSDDTYEGPDKKKYQSVNKYYLEESGESYSLKGDVYGWYTAKNNIEYYGDNNADQWYGEQKRVRELVVEALENIAKDENIDLSQYDIEDRNDFNNNKNYREPDGEIDHLIIVHAGRGEEMGGGSMGEDAIWPFRWVLSWDKPYEFKDANGKTWKANDFLTVEEDAMPGLIAHEYGHDLGLPDLYGTDGNSAEPVQYWSTMSSASYSGEIPGTMPGGLGAYCKQFLQAKHGGNWLKGNVINFEDISEEGETLLLDQSSSKGTNLDAVRINLPKKEKIVVTPPEGSYTYFSGKGDNLRNSMIANVDLRTLSSAQLTFKTWYDIDPEWDYASVQVRESGTDEWIAIKGNITTDQNPNDDTPSDPTDRNPGHGITFDSGDKWVNGVFDLGDYLGKEIELKFYFWTDGNTPEKGIYIDDINIVGDGNVIFSDNAEEEVKFQLDGFVKTDGIQRSNHYYLLEWRNHQGVDQGLSYMPWVPGKVAYDPGLVIWYINPEYVDIYGRPDQNVAGHKGECFAGVVDSDQNIIKWHHGENSSGVDRVKYQLHDAAFSIRKSSEVNLNWTNGAKTVDKETFMHPYFDDNRSYENEECEQAGLNIENYGLRIYVTGESKDRSIGRIHITRSE